MLRRLVTAVVVLALSGCATPRPQDHPRGSRCAPGRAFAEGGERATLWVRNSAEYPRFGRRNLPERPRQPRNPASPMRAGRPNPPRLADSPRCRRPSSWTSTKPCSTTRAPQARMLLEETCAGEFDALWDAWLAERAAPPCRARRNSSARRAALKDPSGPSSARLLHHESRMQARAGSSATCPQQDDTLANLRAARSRCADARGAT